MTQRITLTNIGIGYLSLSVNGFPRIHLPRKGDQHVFESAAMYRPYQYKAIQLRDLGVLEIKVETVEDVHPERTIVSPENTNRDPDVAAASAVILGETKEETPAPKKTKRKYTRKARECLAPETIGFGESKTE